MHNENQTSSEIFVDGPSWSLTLDVPSQEPVKNTSFFKNSVPNSKAEATQTQHQLHVLSVADTMLSWFYLNKKKKAIMF